MKKNISLLFILFSLHCFSQRKYAKEFSFLNDNDLYISTYQDRYYTNGAFLTYRYLSEKQFKNIEKRAYEIQVGHHMYTPFKSVVETVEEHDRPFAGYLYGSFGINSFYKKEVILKTSIQIGVIGSHSFSEELQDFIHKMYGFKKATGWDYQIKNAFAINFKTDYIKKITRNDVFDINWANTAKLGTVYTDFSTGLYSRIGFKPLENIINSIAFNGNLNNSNTHFSNNAEVFLYIKPMIYYVAYDATIEGSFLANDDSPITFDIEPFKFTSEIGLRFTSNRFNFGYAIHYHTRKLKSEHVSKGNFYGTIKLSYQFN
ncbi:lipid A deacylase LpxR family protein [Tenacibaculum sp.]|uniref:lipid A deacylase LpxR family protein n=1 Tax=Tenacibaculum sp. TaxID=1906242 RepID=UPI003D0E5B1A